MNNADNVDLLLIGAGPSNIALAVALEEQGSPEGIEKIVMLEAGDSILWHRGMLFPEAQSQVSFLKDLVTLRDPTSKFSFLNFKHKTGRLTDFVNLQTFFPYRREISDYLQWCVDLLCGVEVRYSSAVTGVKPTLNADGQVSSWTVTCGNGRSYSTKKIVYGGGRDANLPEPFCNVDSQNLLHASRFLDGVKALDADKIQSIAVIGGAQSSAEVYQECLNRFPAAKVKLMMRSFGFIPYGGSKFTNDYYSNEFVDMFYNAPSETRHELLTAMHDSNYAGVTPNMLDSLFRFHYLQNMDDEQRAQIFTAMKLQSIEAEGERINMKWSAGIERQFYDESFDMVVLGTGYKNEVPALFRETVDALGIEDMEVTRGYRAKIKSSSDVSLYLLGINEATHGISDTLLSVVGSRAAAVIQDISGHNRASQRMMPTSLNIREAAVAVAAS